jgi:hypothetical protein
MDFSTLPNLRRYKYLSEANFTANKEHKVKLIQKPFLRIFCPETRRRHDIPYTGKLPQIMCSDCRAVKTYKKPLPASKKSKYEVV